MSNLSKYIIVVCLSVILLLTDLYIELGVAIGITYILVVLLGVWFKKTSTALYLALISSICILVGWYFSQDSIDNWKVTINRLLSIGFIWLIAIIIYGLKRNSKIDYFKEFMYNVVFDQTFHFISLINLEGKIIEINESALDISNTSSKNAINTSLWELPLWSGKQHLILELKDAIQKSSKGEYIRYEVDIENTNQSISLDFSLRPIFNKKNEVIYIVVKGVDITEKNKLQKKIIQTNKLFEEVQKVAKIGVWRVTLNDMKAHWSDEVYRIHEVELGTEIDVEKGIEFYHPDYRQTIEQAINKAISDNKAWDEEAILITKNKKEVWVRAIGYPIFKDDTLVELRGLFMNIDEKKKTESKLIQSKKRLSLALSVGEIGIWDWDIKNNNLFWDDSMYTLYDVKRSDFSGDYDAWSATLYPEDKELAEKAVADAMSKIKDFDTEFRIISSNNEIKYIQAKAETTFDKEGNPIRMIGVNLDITKTKLQEEKLKKLNDELEDLIGEKTKELDKTSNELIQNLELISNASIISVLDKNGKISHVNKTFCEISGYSESELLGLDFKAIKSKIHPEEFFNSLIQTIASGEKWKGEICNKRKDGTLYWTSTFVYPFKDKDNNIEKYVGLHFDITSLKEKEEKLKQQTLELEKANTNLDNLNKDLETFSYSVSHDLKAPLRALQGFSDNLYKKYQNDLDETGLRWLTFIKVNAERMNQLILEILNFSRINRKEIQKVEVDINAIVNNQIRKNSLEFKKELKLNIKELPKIKADQTMIEIVWQNLIHNAFKYSSKNDIISIEIESEINAGFTSYSISDNGSGFDMRYYDKLFGIFQRLHANDEYEGTGIGLANVKKIIEKHGGSISAESRPGKGAKFEFKLPN